LHNETKLRQTAVMMAAPLCGLQRKAVVVAMQILVGFIRKVGLSGDRSSPRKHGEIYADLLLAGICLLKFACWDNASSKRAIAGEYEDHVDKILWDQSVHQQPKWYTLKDSNGTAFKYLFNLRHIGSVKLRFTLLDHADPAASPNDTYQKFRS
jgi:hypothetical protein